MTRLPTDDFAAFVGLDWADAKHDVCLQAAGSKTREFSVLAHTPETIDEWVSTLHKRFNGQPIAICLELNKGPIVYALRKYDFLVLFPVNPLTLARYREAFAPSHAKDDHTDAELPLELLLKHREKLTPLNPQSPAMRALEQLLEHRRRLVGDKVRLTNRLTSTLKNYFPHVLPWFHDKDTATFCDFLTQWPTLKAVQLARRSTLERFFRDHHVRYADVTDTRIQAIKSATPLTTDEGVITPNAQRSSDRRSWNGRRNPCGIPSGHALTISNSATRARHTRLLSGPWRSNGFAFSFGVGRIARRTMKRSISTHCNAEGHHFSTILPMCRKKIVHDP